MIVTLFLGAGFSRHYNLPVMDEFVNHVQTNPKYSGSERSLLIELQQFNSNTSPFIGGRRRNLEDILSTAIMRARLGLGESETLPALLNLIRSVYTSNNFNIHFWRMAHEFVEFFGIKIPSSGDESIQMNIVTTNYDLIIECLIYSNRRSVNYHLKDIHKLQSPSQTEGFLSTQDGVSLFKLHGSANWFESSDGDSIIVDSGIVRSLDFDEKQYTGVPTVAVPNYKLPGKPVIVPPSFLKPDLGGPLGSVWSGAAKAISQSHQLVFVGYSFPQSDVEMKYFFGSALANNQVLDRIKIIDPRANDIFVSTPATPSTIRQRILPSCDPVFQTGGHGWRRNPLS